MKKLLVLAAALLILLPASAMAGMTAFMDMDELSNTDLSGTTGQAGIDLVNSLTIITGGYIGWGDDNGCTTTVNATNQGWLTLSSLWGSVSLGSLANPVTIDVCGGRTGGTWLTIVVPGMTLNQGVRAIKVGNTINSGASLGELQIVNLSLSAMTIQVQGH